MKLLAPLSRVDEVEMLIGSGAGELYCGLVPEAWTEKQGGWLNRRSPRASFTSWSSLAEAAHKAKKAGVPVYLTVNAPSYQAAQWPLLLEMAERAVADCGLDAFIVSDPGLVSVLADQGYCVHVSSVAAVHNAQAACFFRDLGAKRIILPRSLSLIEIEGICAAVGADLEIEVFLLNDGCAYEEGLCRTSHMPGGFCSTAWDYGLIADDPIAPEVKERWLANLADYRKWIWYLNSCGNQVSAKGLPLGPCGLCALPELQRIGVSSLKIVGREASFLRKLGAVQLAKAVLDKVGAVAPEEVMRYAQQLRDTPQFCADSYMCYYR
ncbi:U32 family peptidase [Heliobacterium gestii]|uniref:U32 family peptidase n=1 Tax=Heliomicrobium gestii TaxID=2699 RepID=A0A845LDG2_HELGE|nr:U32 family peptidase [Heliomicrobium gestii]MBM7866234.1 putative protease [Heliomicrobium gestii]MZP42970.1 U32 family peptidase [Heliomicrobium gestii]